MIVLIDNYDSFTYNLVHLIGREDIKVIRNDKITVNELLKLNPSAMIISPGPGRPADAGICEEAVLKLAGKVPILGVCLGHQAICEAFGGKIVHAKRLMHGKRDIIYPDSSCPLFEGLGKEITAARYHSLAVSGLPECLEVTASSGDGEIMAVKHRDYEIYGLQFHPESVMTEDGDRIIKNFLKRSEK